ncbi:MAG: hypothetical protein KTR25_00575 [Myxococcales bacterium]|nr:hypothetical protein [Myxococcales bacterium]
MKHELVPVAPRGSLFASYQRREGILVNLMAGTIFVAALGSAAISSVAVGPLWGLTLLGLGLASVSWLANAWGLFGNRDLAARLRSTIQLPENGPWTFVGLCRGSQNRLAAKLFPPRVETDENVGFFGLFSDRLELRMEDTTVTVPRSHVRDIRLEEVVEAPLLRWIRVELYNAEGVLESFLMMSREGENLREQQQANVRMFEDIRDWHIRDKLEQLVDAGELSELALEAGVVT